jgi:PUCC protein
MPHRKARRSFAVSILRSASFVLLLAAATACSPSIYGWTVRTTSTLPSRSFQPLEGEPVAIFEAHASGGLRGNELGLAPYLAQILARATPEFKVISPQDTASRINTHGLVADYARTRADFEQTNILEAATLRKLGAAVEARYVCQPRLAAFTQTMTNRWAPSDLRVVQTRWSILRLSLQLWDTHTGEPIWSSIAEAVVSGEVVLQDPVFVPVLLLYGLFQGIWPLLGVASSDLAADLAPFGEGTAMGLFNAAAAIASALGAVVGGAVADMFGFASVIVLGAVGAFVALLCMLSRRLSQAMRPRTVDRC